MNSGPHSCVVCAKPFEVKTKSKYCNKCWRGVVFLRSVATKELTSAIERGDIPHPKTMLCADCSKPAQCYDHRDYSKPLQVVPVCLSCNCLRGPALTNVDSLVEKAPRPPRPQPPKNTRYGKWIAMAKKMRSEVLRLHLEGNRPADIARCTGVSPQRVSQIIKSAT